MKKKTLPAALLAVAVLAAGAGGCDSQTSGTGADAGASETASTPTGSQVEVVDPWIKAAGEGEMTALFATLRNTGDEDAVVVSGAADVSPMVELHETVMGDDGSMMMQPKEDGFAVAAGGEHVLEPGGDHLMMMGLRRTLEPGEVVTVTLTLADGTTLDVDATVKPFEGGNEQYQPSDGM